MNRIDYTNLEELKTLFVGRTVYVNDDDTLVLDNGVKVTVEPNQGCWGCVNGNFTVDFLNNVDHVITDITVVEHPEPGSTRTVFELFIYTAGIAEPGIDGEHPLLSVSGEAGNGWYGTGFKLLVEHDNLTVE